MAVAFPCSEPALAAAIESQQLGLADPVLVGPAARLHGLAHAAGLQLKGVRVMDTGDDPRQAARAAVDLCRQGAAAALVKGSLHTDELMAAVVDRERGLRTERRISHGFVIDVVGYPGPFVLGDCVVNIEPQLMDKRDITQNCIDLARAIGIPAPRVAVLSAVESINPAIRGTLDAAALSKMAERGQITGASAVEGPLAFDVAISAHAARVKGMAHGGYPDVLIVPGLEAGNLLYKQLVWLSGADCAGLVLGASVPVVLTSRADSALSRVASCALAVLVKGGAAPIMAHRTRRPAEEAV